MPEATTLTPLQRRYCELRSAGMKSIDAIIKVEADAGMKPRKNREAYGSKAGKLNMLPQIAAYMAELDANAAALAGVTVRGILDDLLEIKNRCMQAEPVRDREGNETGQYEFREQGALRSLELLGKHLKMFVDRTEHTGKDGGPIETKEMGDLELARRILFDLNNAERKRGTP